MPSRRNEETKSHRAAVSVGRKIVGMDGVTHAFREISTRTVRNLRSVALTADAIRSKPACQVGHALVGTRIGFIKSNKILN